MPKQTPQELLPALERPLDKASIDQRMTDQLDFESHLSRFNPDENFLSNADKNINPKKVGKLKKAGRTTLVAAGLLASAAGVGKLANDETTPQPKSNSIPVNVILEGGQQARTVVSVENATPAQINAQVIKENGGQLPGAP